MGRVVFYGSDRFYPGGVKNLIINLCKDLANKGLKPVLISYSNSYIYKRLIPYLDKITFIDKNGIYKSHLESQISSNDVILIFNFTSNLRPFLKINPYILFWSVLPTVFRKANDLILYSSNRRTVKLLNYLSLYHSLVFMDQSCSDALIQDFQYKDDKIRYLPIPTSLPTVVSSKKQNSLGAEKLTITYLGRGEVMWKIHSAVKILKDLAALQLSLNIDFVIITNTNKLFEKEIKKIDLLGINVVYKFNLIGEELNMYFIQNADLCFAMGTSALESAKLGIPTVLVDASYTEFPDGYKYIWLHETSNYSLGTFIDKYIFKNGGVPLGQIIQRVLIEYDLLSHEASNYVLKNHSLNEVTETLLDICEKSKSKLDVFIHLTYRQSRFFQMIRDIYIRFKQNLSNLPFGNK